MPSLNTVVKMGYAMILVSLLLMIWASYVQAWVNTDVAGSNCLFNPLCTCTKVTPDLGIVRCFDVPMPRLPPMLNGSKLSMLHMENNGMRFFEPHFFQHTGLYRLVINHNALDEIPDEAFLGLEGSLSELTLRDNLLISIPSRPLRHLKKMTTLNLEDNHITEVYPESWRGLESSLKTLVLANNWISTLPTNAFASLSALVTLDIRGNAFMELDVDTFRSGPPRLTALYLADNQLSSIPYQQLSKLKLLRTLDLSFNRITGLKAAQSQSDTLMSLNTLRLDYNQIQHISPGAFQNFDILNITFLDGNPLSVIQAGAFKDVRIRELSLRDCGISELAEGALSGLAPSLQVLDLAGNNLTDLPDTILTEYDYLHTLSIRDNNIDSVYPDSDTEMQQGAEIMQSSINEFQYSLFHVNLGGRTMGATALHSLSRMRNLRSLSLSRLPKNHLSPDDFLEFGVDLEELQITEGNLQVIKNHAFKYVRGLNRLNLADNMISTIEPEAFSEVGHSLKWLSLSHALSSSLTTVFGEALRPLTSVQTLDLSNNRLRSMPETSFHFLGRLQVLQLEDNQIDQVHKGTFQGSIHSDLKEIYLSYNNLDKISTGTFAELSKLVRLHLDDNRIKNIERHSFTAMKELNQLTLRGNKIQSISPEAFQTLPKLGILDLAYNKLTGLDLAFLDQVANEHSLIMNVSHNEIQSLTVNKSGRDIVDNIELSVQMLDLSSNNISVIGNSYFKPLESSLTHLYLRDNAMQNATRDTFGHMMHLQWLDLTENELAEIDFDTFKFTISIQVLLMSQNDLTKLPHQLFQSLDKLRIVKLDRNKLNKLPDSLFNGNTLEHLDLSHNLFSLMPMSSIGSNAAASLCELDCSHNSITTLDDQTVFSRFKSLSHLDVSHNRLVRLHDAIFFSLPLLLSLDLSHNMELMLESQGRTFQGLGDTLFELNLRNTSLTMVPDLPLGRLRSLNLADNQITVAPFEAAVNLSSLRRLDMRDNRLESVPPLARLLPQLRELMLGGNMIPTLSNSSFLPAAERLKELDLQHLPLTFFESGALSKMRSLQSFHVSPYPDIYDFNLGRVLKDNNGLLHLHIQVEGKEEITEGMMSVDLPAKVKNLTITGQPLRYLPYNLLQGICSPNLHFMIYNTTLENLPRNIFQQAHRVRNITLDLRNNTFRGLGNPNTGELPGLPRSMFLQDLKLVGNRWSCDCDLGWVEMWNRKKRQYMCPESNDDCRHEADDLRLAQCTNKNNESLMQVFKTDIECGWGSGARAIYAYGPLLVVAAILAIVPS